MAERQGLGMVMRGFRERAGMTALNVAVAIDRDPASVYRWEQGKVSPTVRDLEAYCEAVGCSVVDLYIPTNDHDSAPPQAGTPAKAPSGPEAEASK